MRECFSLGALALLGALTFKLILWPIFCCAVSAAPAFRLTQNTENIQQMEFNDTSLRQTSSIYDIFLETSQNISSAQRLRNKSKRVKEMRSKRLSTLERNERSANLSHISGSARKIQLYIKNRFLQLMPDGVVNGTSDFQSDYAILQRTTVNVGQIKIQGVATCLFLCMDNCGMVYGSAEFTDDCVFNESIEQHHYNTYSSTYNSNAKRTFYLGLNRHGQPRKIQIPTSRQLGKLSTYTKSLTQTVSQERVDQLIARLYGQNHLRHGLKQLCDAGKSLHHQDIKKRKNKLKCSNLGKSNTNVNKGGGHNKRKKKKRKCRDDETENDQCVINHSNNNNNNNSSTSVHSSKNNNSQATHGGKRKPSPQKMCDRDDCNNNKKNGNKKKPPKKNNNHSKFNNQSISSNSKQKSAHKVKATKIYSSKDILTTTRPDDIDHDHDIVDMTNGSDEFNEEDDYEELVGGHTANFVDESYFDDN